MNYLRNATIADTEALMAIASTLRGAKPRHFPSRRVPDGRYDVMLDPEATVRFLDFYRRWWGDRGIAYDLPRGVPTRQHLVELRALRDAVQGLADGDRTRWEKRLRSLLRHHLFQLDTEGNVRPIEAGWPGFISRLLVPLIEIADFPQRVRLCANPACRWAIYDHSKSSTRRWCHAAACGNLMKVRAFRARARTFAGKTRRAARAN